MAGLKWIKRTPLSIKKAQNKILEIDANEWKDSKIAERESEYGNIKQRWLIIESELRKKSSIKQIEKQVEKQQEKAEGLVRKLYSPHSALHFVVCILIINLTFKSNSK